MPALATPSIPADLNAIVQRIHEKMANYERYNFSADHNDFLKAFFDLSQEYDQMEDFYRICVAVPLTVAAIPCDLYLCRKPDGVLELVCSCDCGLLPRPEPAVWPVYLSEISYIDGGHFVAPIFSHHSESQGGLIQGGVTDRLLPQHTY